MKIHVITAITRPENLPRICMSLAKAAVEANIDIVWHWRFDLDKNFVGGHKIKNDAIDDIQDGWIWILDDDTSVNPDLFLELSKVEEDVDALVVSQSRADGWILKAAPENSRVDAIDAGQAIIRRSAIGKNRLAEVYNGDGIFLEAVLKNCNVKYSDKILSYHNII